MCNETSIRLELDDLAKLLAEKTRHRMASIHIDAGGLIRLGSTNAQRLERFNMLCLAAESYGANLMIPTYSYTHARNKGVPFDVLHTPSIVGAVTEYLRQRNPHKRTIDGLFSYLLFSNQPDPRHFRPGDYESFGDDSLVGQLYRSDGYICCIGNVFHNSPTEVHFIERMLDVPYRHNKRFPGHVIDRDGRTHAQDLLFYCRRRELDLSSDMTRLERSLRERELFEYWRVPGLEFEIEAVPFHSIEQVIRDQIGADPHFLCSQQAQAIRNKRNRRAPRPRPLEGA